MEGLVKWFSEKKGYGFIVPTDGSEEVFVHYSKIIAKGFRTLKANDKVSFEIETGESDSNGKKAKGPRAVNVTVINS